MTIFHVTLRRRSVKIIRLKCTIHTKNWTTPERQAIKFSVGSPRFLKRTQSFAPRHVGMSLVSWVIQECKFEFELLPWVVFLFDYQFHLCWIFYSGKSSLLNGLLDEAAVLPTFGSRGCTAAVVELVFHSELTVKTHGGQSVPVYKGEIEFIKLEGEHLTPLCHTHNMYI